MRVGSLIWGWLADAFCVTVSNTLSRPRSGSSVDDVIGWDQPHRAEIVWDGDAVLGQQAKTSRLAVPAFLGVGDGLRFHGGKTDFGVNLVDADRLVHCWHRRATLHPVAIFPMVAAFVHDRRVAGL